MVVTLQSNIFPEVIKRKKKKDKYVIISPGHFLRSIPDVNWGGMYHYL